MRAIKLIACLMAAGASLQAQDDLQRGKQALAQGRYVEASTILQHTPGEAGSGYRALALAAAGRCGEALPRLSQPSKDAPLNRLTHMAAVKCWQAQGSNVEAEQMLQRLLLEAPKDGDVLYLAAKFHMTEFNKATLRMFQDAPASFRVHELSAEIFEVENRWSEAAAEYRKAIAMAPAVADLHYRLGRALLLENHEAGGREAAAAAFEAELALSPEDSASAFQLGQIALAQGKMAEAKRRFAQAVQISPDFAGALLALGKLETREKEFSEATQHLTRAAQLQPQNEGVHYALMTAYRDGGKTAEAQRESAVLEKLRQPASSEFSNFLKKIGEKPPQP